MGLGKGKIHLMKLVFVLITISSLKFLSKPILLLLCRFCKKDLDNNKSSLTRNS